MVHSFLSFYFVVYTNILSVVVIVFDKICDESLYVASHVESMNKYIYDNAVHINVEKCI